jgi:hypothetical protein
MCDVNVTLKVLTDAGDEHAFSASSGSPQNVSEMLSQSPYKLVTSTAPVEPVFVQSAPLTLGNF